MKTVKFGCVVALCLMLALATSGCKTHGPKPMPTETVRPPEPGEGGEQLPSIDMDKIQFTRAPELKPIYFDFDKSDLRPDALTALNSNADEMKRMPANTVFQVEGHCDERGTQEYNMALGERRALAARAHLMKLGISGERIVTISYGEEVPADPGHSEAAWAKNRRCEFNKSR